MLAAQLIAHVALAFFVSVMVLAAHRDAATLTISNRLVACLGVGYVPFALLSGLGFLNMGYALATGVSMLLMSLLLFSFGLIGGGDAKFAAVTSVWLGPEGVLIFIACTTLIGGMLALALLIFRTLPLPAFLSGHAWVRRMREPTSSIPYALAMSPAALLAIPSTKWAALIA